MSLLLKIEERVVAEIWERQAYDRAALAALGLQLVFRGVPSDAGGPDYQDALLTNRENKLMAGDVEFHVKASDWFKHQHHTDRRYNQVVLHVVWTRDIESTKRQDGEVVPTLEVGSSQPFFEPDVLGPCPEVLLPHPCIDSFGRFSEDELRQALRRAGLVRFIERKDQFAAEFEVLDSDQVAYAALLRALGYASNADVFQRLAEIAPYAWLRSIPSRLWPHALLDAAGLGPPCIQPVPVRLPLGVWRLARLRPGNHPALRLVGAAQLLGSVGPSLAEGLCQSVMKSNKPRDVAAFLQVRDNGASPIGYGRAAELAVSVVLPLVAALQPHSAKPEALFSAHASPPRNKWTRLMEDRFEAGGHTGFKIRGAIEHQGAHFLYHRFCRPERFSQCICCGPLAQARHKTQA